MTTAPGFTIAPRSPGGNPPPPPGCRPGAVFAPTRSPRRSRASHRRAPCSRLTGQRAYRNLAEGQPHSPLDAAKAAVLVYTESCFGTYVPQLKSPPDYCTGRPRVWCRLSQIPDEVRKGNDPRSARHPNPQHRGHEIIYQRIRFHGRPTWRASRQESRSPIREINHLAR
jgi:hypothetical protein